MANNLTITLEVDAQTGRLTQVSDQFGRLDNNIQGANRSMGGFRNSTDRLVSAASGLYIFTEIWDRIGESVQKTIATMDAYTTMQSRLRLVTDSTQELLDVQEQLFEVAQRNRVDLSETADLYRNISMATSDLGTSQKELISVTDNISKSLLISGGNAESAKAALTQLGQAFSADFKAVGQELASLREQTPRLYQAIVDGLGVTKDQFRKMAEDGKLSSEMILKAIQSQTEKLNSELGNITMTVGQANQQVSNSFMVLAGEIDKTLGITKSLSGWLSDFSKLMDGSSESVIFFGKTILELGAAFAIYKYGGMMVSSMRASLLTFNQTAQVHQSLAAMNGQTITRMGAAYSIAQTRVVALGVAIKGLALSVAPFAAIIAAMEVWSSITGDIAKKEQEVNGILNTQVSILQKRSKEQNQQSINLLNDKLIAEREIISELMREERQLKRNGEANSEEATALRAKIQDHIDIKNQLDTQVSTIQSIVNGTYTATEATNATANAAVGVTNNLSSATIQANALSIALQQAANALGVAMAQHRVLMGEISKATATAIGDTNNINLARATLAKTEAEIVALGDKYLKQKNEEVKASVLVEIEKKKAEILKAQTTLQTNINKEIIHQNETKVKTIELQKREKELAINVANVSKNDAVSRAKVALELAQNNAKYLKSELDVVKVAKGSIEAKENALKLGEADLKIKQAEEALAKAIESQEKNITKAKKAGGTASKEANKALKEANNLIKQKEAAHLKYLRATGQEEKANMLELQKEASEMKKLLKPDEFSRWYDAELKKVKGSLNDFSDDIKGMFDGLFSGDLSGGLESALGGISSKLLDPLVNDISTKMSNGLTQALASIDPTGGLLSGAVMAIGGALLGDMLNSTSIDAYSAMEGRVDSDNDSVVTAIDTLAGINTRNLEYSSKMANSLDTMVRSLDSVGTSLSLNLRTAADVDSYKQGTLGFSSTQKQFKAGGIAFEEGQSLLDAVDDLQVSLFTTIEKTKKKFWGLSTKVSTTTEFEEASQSTVDSLESAISDGIDTISLGLQALGIDKDLSSVLETITLDSLAKIDLTDMNAQERSDFIAQLLGEKLDEVVDKATQEVTLTGGGMWGLGVKMESYLDDFSQRGEDSLETLVRLSSGVESATNSLSALGITAINFRDISDKQGDVYTELIRDSIIAYDGLESGISGIINSSERAGDELITFYTELGNLENSLRFTIDSTMELTQEMLNGAGSLEALQSGYQSYYNNFLSLEEQLGIQTQETTLAFQQANITMPQTREEFKALINSLEGESLGAALTLSDTFNSMLQMEEQLASQRQAAEDRRIADEQRAQQARAAQYAQYAENLKRQQEESERARLQALKDANREYSDLLKEFERMVSDVAKDIESSQSRASNAVKSIVESIIKNFEDGQKSIANIDKQIASLAPEKTIGTIDVYSAIGKVDSSEILGMISKFGDQQKANIDKLNEQAKQAEEDRVNALNKQIEASNEASKAWADAKNEAIEAANAVTQSFLDLKKSTQDTLLGLGTKTIGQASTSLDMAIAGGDASEIQKAFDSFVSIAGASATSEADLLSKVALANAKVQSIEVEPMQNPVVATIRPLVEAQPVAQLTYDSINQQMLEMLEATKQNEIKNLPNIDQEIKNLNAQWGDYVTTDFKELLDNGYKDKTAWEILEAEKQYQDEQYALQSELITAQNDAQKANTESIVSLTTTIADMKKEITKLKDELSKNTTATKDSSTTSYLQGVQ